MGKFYNQYSSQFVHHEKKEKLSIVFYSKKDSLSVKNHT